jgi:hypothetical protein
VYDGDGTKLAAKMECLLARQKEVAAHIAANQEEMEARQDKADAQFLESWLTAVGEMAESTPGPPCSWKEFETSTFELVV